MYYRGSIHRLMRGSETGIVRSLQSGRETVFAFRHVEMRGALRRFADLREGMEVGFDVGWTAGGLRVTVLHAPLQPPLQGQSSAKQEIPADDLADGDTEDGDIE